MNDEIIVYHVNPPTHIRKNDWCATRDCYEGEVLGWGETKEQAIDNLLEIERLIGYDYS